MMRQIYKAGCEPAWIGDSAPVPDGWSADVNAIAKEKDNAVREEEKGREEEVKFTPPHVPSDDHITDLNNAPRRGRPRKGD